MRRQFSTITLAATLGLAITFTLSCSSDNINIGDGGGNNIANYKTKQIGDQVWMAENLNYNVTGSKCYDNDPANCTKYGRLYDWEAARTVCPTGWHLPTNAEWDILTAAVGGEKTAGKYLKATSGWNNDGNGTDAIGFSALPGGYGNSDGDFGSVGKYGYWWSATEYGASVAYYWRMYHYYAFVYSTYGDKAYLYSVRCVQD